MRTARSLAAAFAAAALLTTIRASHDESVGARFVQSGGIDAGDCLDHQAPCISIRYALAQAQPGNTVKVGAGVFDLSGIDPETYLHGPVHAAAARRPKARTTRPAAARSHGLRAISPTSSSSFPSSTTWA